MREDTTLDDLTQDGPRWAMAPLWVMQHPDLSPSAKVLFVVLMGHTTTGYGDVACYPGQGRLAVLMSTTERTVRRLLVELESVGAVVVEQRTRGNGSRTTNRYTLRQQSPEDTSVLPPRTPVSSPELEPLELELEQPSTTETFDAQFEQWWTLYPRKLRKAEARKVYLRLVGKSQARATALHAAVSNYRHAVQGKSPQYVMHATTFLREERWRDYVKGNNPRSEQRPQRAADPAQAEWDRKHAWMGEDD